MTEVIYYFYPIYLLKLRVKGIEKSVQNPGVQMGIGYEANDESIQVHHCICHRVWHHILDSCGLTINNGFN